jgi:hypothetical protein
MPIRGFVFLSQVRSTATWRLAPAAAPLEQSSAGEELTLERAVARALENLDFEFRVSLKQLLH